MFITGPQVIKQVTGEQITAEALGGADAHMAHSGVTHFVAEDDERGDPDLPSSCSASCPRTTSRTRPVVDPDNNVDPDPELADDRARRSASRATTSAR